MAGKRFILFYQLQSFLNPIPRVAFAFFILYFNPAAFWMLEATAIESIDTLPKAENSKSDWQLVNSVDAVSFHPSAPNSQNSSSSTEGQIAAAGLVHEAVELYQSGQFLMALRTWQQASVSYGALGDRLNQALTLSNQSLAHQQLGQTEQAKSAIFQSLRLVENVETKPQNVRIVAQILSNQGSWQLATGQAEQALIAMQKAGALYDAAGDRAGKTQSLLTSAGAMQSLGLYRRAVTVLDEVAQNLRPLPDSPTKAVAFLRLGNALQGVGDLPRARQTLEQSLKLANSFGLRDEIEAALISLGNVARAQSDKKAAWQFYQQAALSTNRLTVAGAKINSLSLLIEHKSINAAATLAQQIASEIKDLPPLRATIYASINFAQSLKKLKEIVPSNNKIMSEVEIAELLADTVKQAKSIEDPIAEAYALGSLGSLYEHTGQWNEAKKLTQQALALAGASSAPDINYRFSWQMGRVLKALGDINGALASYTRSTNALKALRNDIVAVSPTLQFDFRDEVEPVYRELAGLLLLSNQPSQQNLIQARDAIEALQVAELNNFFRTACLETKPIQVDSAIDKLGKEAAVIYPIILPERLEVIVKLPGQPLQHYRAKVTQNHLEKLLQQLQSNFSKQYALSDTMKLSKQVHDWLIEPALDSLVKSRVKTLVFVLDGSLRNIPMAALYDGKQYLIQKYAVVLNPGLNLLPPQPIKKVKLKALSAGLSLARQGFSALANVPIELNQIKSEVESTVLLNQTFTTESLKSEMEQAKFSIVHLATHAQFSSQADKTFILAWDKPIFVNNLDLLLRSVSHQHSEIELLVLSACQTASGDNRAALGLAGVAVKAGARSTLASLWPVDDEAGMVLMTKFYQELSDGRLNKGEALRMAQLALLQSPNYNSPNYWASYVLVGNWL